MRERESERERERVKERERERDRVKERGAKNDVGFHWVSKGIREQKLKN